MASEQRDDLPRWRNRSFARTGSAKASRQMPRLMNCAHEHGLDAPYFCPSIAPRHLHRSRKTQWMGDRAVYCARLESVCTARYRGFESPPIRHFYKLAVGAGQDQGSLKELKNRSASLQIEPPGGARAGGRTPHLESPVLTTSENDFRGAGRPLQPPCNSPGTARRTRSAGDGREASIGKGENRL